MEGSTRFSEIPLFILTESMETPICGDFLLASRRALIISAHS